MVVKKEVKKKVLVVKQQVKKSASRKIVNKISKAQKIQLDIISRTNFNSCDGKRIAELLKENRQIWHAVFMPLNTLSLRSLEQNLWHADTLYIYVEDGFQFALESIVREQFDADEISWVGGSAAIAMIGTTEVREKSNVVLSVWWD